MKKNIPARIIIRDIIYHPSQRVELFRSVKASMQLKIIANVPRHIQKDLFIHLMDEEQVSLLERLDPNDATDLLQMIDSQKRAKLLEKIDQDIQKEITTLLEFDADTAAGLMSLDYIQVESSMSIEEAAEKVKVHESRTGRVPAILVMEDSKLVGELVIYKLGISKPSDKVEKYVKHIASIHHGAKTEEVVEFFRSDPRGKIVVINEDKILGIIYSEDVLRLLDQQHTHSLYEFAGLNDEETVFDSAERKFVFRYKWLILNLATAFLAAFTVGLFEETIARNVLLAVYMPIVAGMGGNAGTQTLAVMVRGLAFHDMKLEGILTTLKNEIVAGFINGLINGLIIFIIVMLFNRDPQIAVILAVAMVINLIVASTFGTLVPIIMKKLGKDPASSATIFITTATDVLGFLAFLGLAALLLG